MKMNLSLLSFPEGADCSVNIASDKLGCDATDITALMRSQVAEIEALQAQVHEKFNNIYRSLLSGGKQAVVVYSIPTPKTTAPPTEAATEAPEEVATEAKTEATAAAATEAPVAAETSAPEVATEAPVETEAPVTEEKPEKPTEPIVSNETVPEATEAETPAGRSTY